MFVTKLLVLYVYVFKNNNQFVNILEVNICAQGGISGFISDRAQSEVSNCAYGNPWVRFINNCKSEPHY